MSETDHNNYVTVRMVNGEDRTFKSERPIFVEIKGGSYIVILSRLQRSYFPLINVREVIQTDANNVY